LIFFLNNKAAFNAFSFGEGWDEADFLFKIITFAAD